MKKSKSVALVLVGAAVASCSEKKPNNDWENANASKNKIYVRGDSTAPYARTHHSGAGLLFYAFRPYYGYSNGVFGRSGFYSDNISNKSNFGRNSGKSGTYRGGFGRISRSGG
jgi:hypothetical protein